MAAPGTEINQNASESGEKMEPTSLALQREVAPPSPAGHRLLTHLPPGRQEQLERCFMGSIYEGRVYFASPFTAHTFESQSPEEMVYSLQRGRSRLAHKDMWVRQ